MSDPLRRRFGPLETGFAPATSLWDLMKTFRDRGKKR